MRKRVRSLPLHIWSSDMSHGRAGHWELTMIPSVRPLTSCWGGTGGTKIVRKGLLNTRFSSSTWAETWMWDCLMASLPCPFLPLWGGEGWAAAGIPPSLKTLRDPLPVLLEPAQPYCRVAWGPDLRPDDFPHCGHLEYQQSLPQIWLKKTVHTTENGVCSCSGTAQSGG